jgi:hypothetical protein
MHKLDVQSIDLCVHTDKLCVDLCEPGVHEASQNSKPGQSSAHDAHNKNTRLSSRPK